MTAPLDGIRVLDLTRVLSGPHCTRMLADLGADVIKVEPPEGDMTRFAAPRVGGVSSYFVQQNIGKSNVSIDLRHPEGGDLVRRLAAQCDVLVENFRPGVADRLGVGAERLRRDHGRLIYCSISGYGATGPWVKRRAYAPSVGAETGLTKAQGDSSGGRYRNDPHNHADVYTALEACTAILAALVQRGVTGEGQVVDVSMAETMMYVNEHAHDALWDGPVDPEWVRSFGTGDFPVVQVGSGEWVVVCGNPIERSMFERLARLIGRPDLVHDPGLSTVSDRRTNLERLHQVIAAFAARVSTAEELEATLAPGGIAVGVIRSMADLAASPWARERQAVVEVPDRSGGRLRLPNVPWRFSASDELGPRGIPKFRGEDNAYVMGELLGLTASQIDDLTTRGVLSQRLGSRQPARSDAELR